MYEKKHLSKENFINSLSNAKSLEEVVDVGYETLGNPFVIFGMVYNLLCHTENTATDDKLWNELVESGRFSHDTYVFFRTEKFQIAYYESEIVSSMKSDKLKYDRLNGKLFDENGEQIGNVAVLSCYKAFESEDYLLLEILCEFVSLRLQSMDLEYDNKPTQIDTFVNNLIEGTEIDMVNFQEIVDNLYCKLKPNLYIGVIDIVRHEPTLTLLIYFKNLFKELQGEFEYFIHLNNIITIMSFDDKNLDVKTHLSTLLDFFQKNNIYAGISKPFSDLFEFKKRYKEAIVALNRGTRNNLKSNIICSH